MRRLIGASILAVSLAMSSVVQAEDDYFRLNLSHTILFGGENPNGGGPSGGGGVGPIEILVDGEVDPQINRRVYGALNIPVTVNGISSDHTVTVSGLPTGATWDGSSIIWGSATIGTYNPTIDVRDADGEVIALANLEIVIHPQLTAAVSQSVYEVKVGGDLKILPTTANAIGAILWGSSPPEAVLPEWLDFNPATGAIAVDTTATNEFSGIVLTGVDQADRAYAATLPFSISVRDAPTGYWISTLASSAGGGIKVGPDGSSYVVSNKGPWGELVLVKYDATSKLIWQRALGSGRGEGGNAVDIGADGAIYVAGHANSAAPSAADALLAKYDSSGSLLWQRTLGGSGVDKAHAVSVAADGSVYIAGETGLAGDATSDVLLAKYNAAGALLWQRTLGGSGIEVAYAIGLAPDGSVYVGGVTNSVGKGQSDLLVAKFNASGALQWQRVYGGTASEYVKAIRVGTDGFVNVAGYTSSIGRGQNDLLIAKISAAGGLQWMSTLGGPGSDDANAVEIGVDGAVYVTGNTPSAAGNDVLIAKFSTAGTLQWQRALGGKVPVAGYSIAAAQDGAIHISGVTNGALLTARLPSSGEPMTAGDFTFEGISLTSASVALGLTTPTWTAGTPSLVSSTSTISARTTPWTAKAIPFVKN